MSIAVSARVGRSRLLALLCISMASTLMAAAMLLADTPILAAVCAIAAVGLALFPLSSPKACRIDVTDIGQILLTDTGTEAVADHARGAIAMVEVVQLLGNSTLWSSLMVLRLQSSSGRVTCLVLLPDSMERETFRALGIACRWIAARGPRIDGEVQGIPRSFD